jgi:uncharacterized protein
MRLIDGQLVFTASDLAGFSRCDHLTTLDRDWATAKLAPFAQPIRSLFADLVSRRGSEHEAQYVSAAGEVQAIEIGEQTTAGYVAAAEATTEAMRRGVSKIYQGVFFDGQWIGIVDFLVRVERPSKFGAWSYETLDVKLARDVRPHFILQLCSYAEGLARTQAIEPEWMRLSLGSGEAVRFRCDDFSAYYRRLKARFLDTVVGQQVHTTPYPNEFCELCHWGLNCWRQWEHEDHLSLVAGIRRPHVQHLTGAGIATLTALGDSMPSGNAVQHLKSETLQRLHDQARLQLTQRRTGNRVREFLPLEDGRGFYRLPPPSPGDLYFDVEADPLVGMDGITYLFGLSSREVSTAHVARWAHDPQAERKAFEDTIDEIVSRRALNPDLHVYHYGAADVSALKRHCESRSRAIH